MSLKPYSDYTDSGIEWLGEIPDHWVVQPAIAICKIMTSSVDKKSYDGEIPVRLCNYTDVYYNDVVLDDPEYMEATATPAQISLFTPRAGDVAITKDSESSDDIGVSSYVPRDMPGVVFGYHLAIYRPFNNRYGRFIKYLFDSKYVKVTFENKTPGVTRVGLGQNTLKYLRVPTPPVQEAQAIADYLDWETSEIDAFIADQEELIGLLSERRRSALHAVAGSISGARQVRLRYLYRQSREANRSDLQVLSVYRDFGVIPKSSRSDNFNKTPEDVSRYLVVRPGYLVVNKMKAWQGSLGISSYTGIVSPDYEVLVPTSNELSLNYAHHMLRSPDFVANYAVRSVGIRPSQWRLYWDQLKDITIPVPDLTVQEDFLHNLRSETAEIDAAIADARESIELSKERRAAVISAAVTGKIDVREHARTVKAIIKGEPVGVA